MGSESSCRIEVDGVAGDGRVLLETDELIVRGPRGAESGARLFRRFFAPGSLEAHDVAPSPHARRHDLGDPSEGKARDYGRRRDFGGARRGIGRCEGRAIFGNTFRGEVCDSEGQTVTLITFSCAPRSCFAKSG